VKVFEFTSLFLDSSSFTGGRYPPKALIVVEKR